jgi:hypothetical protein
VGVRGIHPTSEGSLAASSRPEELVKSSIGWDRRFLWKSCQFRAVVCV